MVCLQWSAVNPRREYPNLRCFDISKHIKSFIRGSHVPPLMLWWISISSTVFLVLAMSSFSAGLVVFAYVIKKVSRPDSGTSCYVLVADLT